MAANTLPFEFGNKATSTVHLADLGNIYYSGASAFKLVRVVTNNLLLTVQGKFVDDSSTTGSLLNTVAALSAVTSARVQGYVSPTQVSLNIGDFFLVQVDGVVVVSGANTVTNGTSVTTAAAGQVANVTGTFAATVPATIIGKALATAAGAAATIQLVNLN